MKLLEYEAKQLLSMCGINVPSSTRIMSDKTPETSLPVVLKSQVPIGGRGKLGGVKIIEDANELTNAIDQLFQLDIKGFKPQTLLAEEKLDIKNEYYFSLVINKQKPCIELVVHKDGGIEVESNSAADFLRIDLTNQDFDAAGQQLADYLDLASQAFSLQDLVENSYNCFVKNDAILLEINPLVLTEDQKLIAGDCKMELDDAAAFRHLEWNFESTTAESNFVTLDEHGKVATIANGAGLAMATVDAVANYGMSPANFLDIGGGASSETVLAAFNKIMEYQNVQAIVVNIFAGITRCDQVAQAIIAAREQIDDLPPLFIRLAGTNVEAAKVLLAEKDIPLLESLDECLKAARQEVSNE